MNRLLPVFAAAVATSLLSEPSLAENAEEYEAVFEPAKGQSGGSVFFHGSCGAECYAATLGCGTEGDVSFVLADVEAKTVAEAITRETQNFAITANGTTFTLTIMNLQWGGEMYGTWNVEGEFTPSDGADFIAALRKSKTFTARLGGEAVTLPASSAVAKWSNSCKP